MSMVVENLPLSRRGLRKKKLPHFCRDGFLKSFSATVLDRKYWH
jgi:hypothetical protein